MSRESRNFLLKSLNLSLGRHSTTHKRSSIQDDTDLRVTILKRDLGESFYKYIELDEDRKIWKITKIYRYIYYRSIYDNIIILIVL